MNQNSNQYMAEESIGRLMLRFSIPCVMSLLVSALYNIVDQIFIGRGIGFLGNGATNVVFPVTIIALIPVPSGGGRMRRLLKHLPGTDGRGTGA